MTDADYAAMTPGASALVRATLLPRGRNGDAGDHVQVAVRGAAVFYVPISEIVDVLPRSRDVIAELCADRGLGRPIAA
jgi:hypothetical protein